MINEPTAAALAYGFYNINEAKKILVLDIGGGTFDVSLMDVYKDILEVLSVAGDNYIGGDDFDSCIMEYFLKQHNLKKSDITPFILAKLRKDAEECKKNINSKNSVNIVINIGNKEYKTLINYEILMYITRDLLIKMKRPILEIIENAVVEIEEIDEIILVGGLPKMPIIKNFILNIFGKLPICLRNPDEVVAIGAGIYGGIRSRNKNLQDIVLTDICPFSLGTSRVETKNNEIVESDIFCPIIRRNTVIPCSKSDSFTTVHDNQEAILFEIYQGESRKCTENFKLGELRINVPKIPAREASVKVKFSYNIDGILEVELILKNTNEIKKISISKEQIDEAVKFAKNNKKSFNIGNKENCYQIDIDDRIAFYESNEKKEKRNLKRKNLIEVLDEKLPFIEERSNKNPNIRFNYKGFNVFELIENDRKTKKNNVFDKITELYNDMENSWDIDQWKDIFLKLATILDNIAIK